jgi:hypothetical protein
MTGQETPPPFEQGYGEKVGCAGYSDSDIVGHGYRIPVGANSRKAGYAALTRPTALTAFSVLACNRCQERWVREHTIPLEFVDEAA